MTALFFTEIFHKVVTSFLWVIILHGISTVTWRLNSWYTCFCNFEQILFVEGTPVTFCITILDFACLYNIPQIPSEDFPHLSTNRNISTIVFQYTSLSLSNIYLTAYSIFWVCVLILWVLLLSLWVMGGLIGNLVMSLFVSPKDLVPTWFLVHVYWRNHEIKWVAKLWGLLTEFYSTAEGVYEEPAQWCVLNCLVWALFSFWGEWVSC